MLFCVFLIFFHLNISLHNTNHFTHTELLSRVDLDTFYRSAKKRISIQDFSVSLKTWFVLLITNSSFYTSLCTYQHRRAFRHFDHPSMYIVNSFNCARVFPLSRPIHWMCFWYLLLGLPAGYPLIFLASIHFLGNISSPILQMSPHHLSCGLSVLFLKKVYGALNFSNVLFYLFLFHLFRKIHIFKAYSSYIIIW